MLDVHPPHAPAHTWKDFLIHIATITVGLLIAVGIERSVEYLHERYGLRETREALERELDADRADMRANVANWLWEAEELRNNVEVLDFLEKHPAVSSDKLPGVLFWSAYPVKIETAAWDTAEQNGTLRLMPLEEANHLKFRYNSLQVMNKQALDFWNSLNDARRFTVHDSDPTHLSPDQLEETLRLTETALIRHIQVGDSLAYLNLHAPELGITLTYDMIRPYNSSASSEPLPARPKAQTLERLRRHGYHENID